MAAMAAHKLGRCLFRFGLIADVQHADVDDAWNYSRTEQRSYRGAMRSVTAAAVEWKRVGEVEGPLGFVAQLGDLIDGQNSGDYGQGKELWSDNPQSNQALERVLSGLRTSGVSKMVNVIGNHELYNFTRQELRERLDTAPNGSEFYGFSPCPGWRVLVLDAYNISVIGRPESSAEYQEAQALLKKHNPNPSAWGQGQGNFFDGMTGPERRYVPYNGGLGAEQLAWFRSQLDECRDKGEKAIVLTHIPLYAPAANESEVVFDVEQVTEILKAAGSAVVPLVLAGHYHGGGFAVDEVGVSHVTVESPLTHEEAYGTVRVHEHGISIQGFGSVGSREVTLGEATD